MTICPRLFWLAPVSIFALVACGGDDVTAGDESRFAVAQVDSGESDLPDDFPADLIPPDYDSVNFADLRAVNGTQAAIFASSAPAREVIYHYIDLLGEPTVNVDAELGGGTDQAHWSESSYPPWLVGIYGNQDESTITVIKPQAQ